MHRPLRSPLSATVLVTQVTAMRLRSIRKLVSIALGLIVLGCLWFYLAPTSIGGSSTYVVTNGVSMEPRFHTGDLAVVRSQSSYHVGEIVAYHNKMFHTVVLHRIVGRDGNRYLFKGDNNNFVDFEHPLASQLIGRLWLHIPGGGSRLKSIRSPALVGVLVALGMLLISGAVFTRQRRRRRRQTQLGESADAPPAHPHRSIEPLVGVLGIGLLALVPFVVLALLAFTHPLTALRPFKIPYKQSGRFSYSADATPGPAYPGNRAVTGEPLFADVLNEVKLHFGYRFETAAKHSLSGKVSLVASMSSSSGWHATVPLGAPTYFRGDHASVDANLDLPSLIALMHRVESATHVNGTYTLAITPHVSTSGNLELIPLRASFAPKVNFSLSEFEAQPAAASGASLTTAAAAPDATSTSEFTPSAGGAATGKRNEPLFITFKLARTTVASARATALVGIALVLLTVLAVLALVRPQRRSETAAIRARYGRLIVPVAHVWQLPGARVIDVADIDALARLAEHYERSILYEVTADGDAFWVTDESGQFRYTVGAPELATDHATSLPQGPESEPPTWEHEIVAAAPVQPLEPSTSELLVNQVYADELELGGMRAPSAPQPALDAPGAAQPAQGSPVAERWALPADADTFVQEGVDKRRTDEDVDVSLWRRNARSGEVGLRRATDADGDVNLWRTAGEDGDVSLWRRTSEDGDVSLTHQTSEDDDVSLWRRASGPAAARPEPVATSGAYFSGLEWTTNS